LHRRHAGEDQRGRGADGYAVQGREGETTVGGHLLGQYDRQGLPSTLPSLSLVYGSPQDPTREPLYRATRQPVWGGRSRTGRTPFGERYARAGDESAPKARGTTVTAHGSPQRMGVHAHRALQH